MKKLTYDDVHCLFLLGPRIPVMDGAFMYRFGETEAPISFFVFRQLLVHKALCMVATYSPIFLRKV